MFNFLRKHKNIYSLFLWLLSNEMAGVVAVAVFHMENKGLRITHNQHHNVGEKLTWFIRHLSDGLYIFRINLWNLPSDIGAYPSELPDVCAMFRLHWHHGCWCHGSFVTWASAAMVFIYRQISNIRLTKSQNLPDSRLVLQLSFPNPLKPGVKSRIKM